MISFLVGLVASFVFLQTLASPEKSIEKTLPKLTTDLGKSNIVREWSSFPQTVSDHKALLYWKHLLKVKSFNNALYQGNMDKLSEALDAGINIDYLDAVKKAASLHKFDMVVKIAEYADSLSLYEAFYQVIFVAEDLKYLDLLLKSTKGRAESSDIAGNYFLRVIRFGRLNVVSTFLDHIDYMTEAAHLKESVIMTKGLFTAYNFGQIDILRMMIAKVDIGANGNAILNCAVGYGYVDLVKILLEDERVLRGGLLESLYSLSFSMLNDDINFVMYDDFKNAIMKNKWLRISDGQSEEILYKWIQRLNTVSRQSLLLMSLAREDHVLSSALMRSLDFYSQRALYQFLFRYDLIHSPDSFSNLLGGITKFICSLEELSLAKQLLNQVFHSVKFSKEEELLRSRIFVRIASQGDVELIKLFFKDDRFRFKNIEKTTGYIRILSNPLASELLSSRTDATFWVFVDGVLEASQNQNYPMARFLMSKIHLSAEKNLLLKFAVLEGDYDLVEFLLRHDQVLQVGLEDVLRYARNEKIRDLLFQKLLESLVIKEIRTEDFAGAA